MALIYIVEDDESIREIETIALKNSNYIVSAFENAKEFYKKLDELVPDLILLDVMLRMRAATILSENSENVRPHRKFLL